MAPQTTLDKDTLNKGSVPSNHLVWWFPAERRRYLCEELPEPMWLECMISQWRSQPPPKNSCVVCLDLLKKL